MGNLVIGKSYVFCSWIVNKGSHVINLAVGGSKIQLPEQISGSPDPKPDMQEKQATMVEVDGENMSLMPPSADTSWSIEGRDLAITIDNNGNVAVTRGGNVTIKSHYPETAEIHTTTTIRTSIFGRQRKLDLGTLWPRVSEQLETSCQEKQEEYRRMEQELKARRAKDNDVEAMRAEIAQKLAEMKKDCKERKAQKEAWDRIWTK